VKFVVVPSGTGCNDSESQQLIKANSITEILQERREVETETFSAEETMELGRALAVFFHPGEVVALFGDLGSGKTTLIKGIVAGLGAPEAVTSPTFTIQHQYHGAELAIYHFDFYRIDTPAALRTIGCEEFFDGEGVCLIEWPDRALDLLPPERWEIFLQQPSNVTTQRKISIRWRTQP